MNTTHWSVTRWVLMVFWIFASLQRSDAIRWTRRPEKPTILIEGVNNTNVALVWEFEVELSETVRSVTFRRQRDVADFTEDIASSPGSTAFTVFAQFISNYSARLPATLILRNAVTSDQEFIYSIEVSFLRNNRPMPDLRDRVQVIVQAISTSPAPSIIAPSPAMPTGWPSTSTMPTSWPSPWIPNPCSNYRFLDGFDRSVANADQSNLRCDKRNLLPLPAWYRFTGAAGVRMPASCVPKRRCGTHAPGWLNGSHPAVREGIVTRRVCYHWNSKCCNWKNDIQIQNCGAFYVYRLVKPPVCHLRYCGNNGASVSSVTPPSTALLTSPAPSIITPSPASTQFPVSSVSLPVYGGLRLVGGRWPGEGRVEIYYRGSWGTICDDSWDINDARVVCRQLGYPSAVSAPHRARFGQGSGEIWLDDVQCQGYESSIGNCRHRPWGVHNCRHSEDASVVCSRDYSIPLPSASSVSPTAAMPTGWPSTSTMPTSWPSPRTMPSPRPSPTRPRFAFTISCYPSAMVAHIARDSLPLGSDASLLHLNDPSCGVNYVTKKSVIIKAPLYGCGTVRRNIGYKVSFHNKVMVPFGYGNKRSLSVFPFKCVYSRFGFP